MQRRAFPWHSLPPALLFAAASGCGSDTEDIVAVGVASDAAAALHDGSAAGPDAGAGGCSVAPAVCRSDFAATAFAKALCSCGDVVARGVLTTDVVGGAPAQSNAAVGVDGALSQAQFVRVGGDLTLAGPSAFGVTDGVQTSGDLHAAAGGTVGGILAVGGDAWLGASVTAGGLATVGGNLHLAPGAALNSLGPANVGGQTSTAPFTVDAPCPCSPEQTLGVAAAISAAQGASDDAALGIAPDALAGPGGATLDVTCGTVVLSSMGGLGPMRINVGGKVSLVVQGDVDLPSLCAIDLAPGAELDWFIGGHFAVGPGARVGDSTRPGALRVYVAGSSTIALPGDSTVALSLYAPSASVVVGGLGFMYGALFAASVTAPAGLVVHDDPLAGAEVCPGP